MMKPKPNRMAGGLVLILAALPGCVRPGSKSIIPEAPLRGHANSSATRTTREPVRITREGSRLIVTPVPALRQAIRRYFRGYDLPPVSAFEPGLRKSLLTSQPTPGEPATSFLCVGDFEGNGLPDVATFLRNRRNRWLLVAFHQTYRGSFHPYRLALSQPLPDGSFACWITLHPPGRVQSYMTAGSGENKAAPRSGHDWIEEEEDGATENFGYYSKGGRYGSVDLD